MTKVKRVSHFERMSQKWEKAPVAYSKPIAIVDTEQNVVGGRMTKKSVIKYDMPHEHFAGIKASDLALENIIAVGAVDQLKDVKLSNTSLDTIDLMDNTIGTLMDAIDAQASQQAVEPKTNDGLSD